mgnify:CR=1 FL=1
MDNNSFIKKLLNKRIPQILSYYFVAGTSVVLFVEYLVSKYQFPMHYPTLALFGIVEKLIKRNSLWSKIRPGDKIVLN